jgi:hypothetical protein
VAQFVGVSAVKEDAVVGVLEADVLDADRTRGCVDSQGGIGVGAGWIAAAAGDGLPDRVVILGRQNDRAKRGRLPPPGRGGLPGYWCLTPNGTGLTGGLAEIDRPDDSRLNLLEE